MNPKKTMREKYAESFADYVIEAMKRTRMRQADIANAAGVSRQLISQIINKRPHQLTGKLSLPERETIDVIAGAFGDPIAKARKTAGYDTSDLPKEDLAQPDTFQLSPHLEKIESIFNSISVEHHRTLLEMIIARYGHHWEILQVAVNSIDIDDKLQSTLYSYMEPLAEQIAVQVHKAVREEYSVLFPRNGVFHANENPEDKNQKDKSTDSEPRKDFIIIETLKDVELPDDLKDRGPLQPPPPPTKNNLT